jgi:hypothetical protein
LAGFGYVCRVCMSLVRIAFGLQVSRRAFKDAFNTRTYRGRRQARRGLLRYSAPIVRLELAKLRLELAKSCRPMLLKHLRDTLVRLELAKTCCAMCA